MLAKSLVCGLVGGFIVRFGCPIQIHSDQGRNFTIFDGNRFRSLYRLLEIAKTRTTPYHPSVNGQVENYNRTILQSIRCYLKKRADQMDWDEHLQLIASHIRSIVKRQTGFSASSILGRETTQPFELVFGGGSELDEFETEAAFWHILRTH